MDPMGMFSMSDLDIGHLKDFEGDFTWDSSYQKWMIPASLWYLQWKGQMIQDAKFNASGSGDICGDLTLTGRCLFLVPEI